MIGRKKKIFFIFIFFNAIICIGAQSVYYGTIKKYSNLYRLSSKNSAILAWLPENTKVFVTSDIAVNGFVSVIYMESGVEGYVYRDMINFTERVAELPLMPNISKFTQQTDSVVLTINNRTLRTLTFKIDNNNYTIIADAHQRIVLSPGQHVYFLYGPKFLPVVGVEMLEKGKNYSWSISAMQGG